jgi:hypothetical protein
MATNKHKKAGKSKKNGSKKIGPAKELTTKQRTRKKLAERTAPKTTAAKGKTAGKKTTGWKSARAGKNKKQSQARNLRVGTEAFSGEEPESRSGEQSGDLQGLSSVAAADSESVNELLEEGNAFEAEAVTGVEDAGDRGEREVRTHGGAGG